MATPGPSRQPSFPRPSALWLGAVLAALLFLAGVWGMVGFAARVQDNPAWVAALSAVASAVTAVMTALGVVGAFCYVALTYRLWLEARRQADQHAQEARFAAMEALLAEYDGLRDSMRAVSDWFARNARSTVPSVEDPVQAFAMALSAPDRNNLAWELSPERFRVSRFFVRIRKLVDAGHLPRDLVVLSLDKPAIAFFLDRIDPLDQAVRSVAGLPPNRADELFYRSLLAEYGPT